MDYDDFFETLDELLTTINGTVQDEADMDDAVTDTHFFSYMFDWQDDLFEDMNEDFEAFPLSPLH